MYRSKTLIYISLYFSFLNASEISFRGQSKEQFLNHPIPLAFTNIITNNYDILPAQINPQRGSYLIIAPDGVIEYLNDFVVFKKSQGFDVYLFSLSEAGGTPANIKNSIASKLVEDPMLEYVLLIGDVDGFAEFPSFYYGPENDVTDQQYTHLVGDDSTPDVFIGRLSIDSLSDLAVIMSKIIQYARDPLAFDSDWLDRGLIVAGNYANTYPIPITPKWTSYWLMDELLDFGYNQIDTVFYPPIQQGAPYITPIIDEGVGIVNYRGWGDANGWHYPEFHVDNVNELNNGWLTPVFFSYVCNSNDFANNVDPCLAEAVIRGGTPTVPKGGVAFIGPSDLHTSTKYNNVINAYMYDAMLNHQVFELGPAMQAGQSGLVKEFPAQNGPGEAQEFYSHVYNILGDPSLQVYINRPNQFSFNLEPLTKVDGLLDVLIENQNGEPVSGAVISVMNNGEIFSKGITDESGRFIASINVNDIYSFDLYANKGGFIQGYTDIIVENPNNALVLNDMIIMGEFGSNKPTLSEQINLTLNIENISDTASDAFTGEVIFSDYVVPNNIAIDVPSVSANSISELESIQFVCYGLDMGQGIIGKLQDNNENIICNFIVNIEQPVFGIEFENQVSSNAVFEPNLLITNYSRGSYTDIFLEISAQSDGAEVILNGSSYILSSFSSFQTSSHVTNYSIDLGDVAYGSAITFLVKFVKNEYSFFSQNVQLNIVPPTDNYPVSPNNYGYWAFDDTDEGFDSKPHFNWIELDPNYGGTNGTHYQLDDDDHVDLVLPFVFKYHGINYETITINSNGWASFEPCNIDYFWNMSIPMYMGPKALLAPFSDDLETIDTDGDGEIDKWINIYTWYDEEIGRFIIEWSRALNGYDETTEETFEIILYNQNSISTNSGDGVIDFLYLEIEDVDVTKNYSTVGIEAPEKNYGLQYVFNNVYSPGAAPLQNERAIRFTTDAPINYIAPLEINDDFVSNKFNLSQVYPNPFNPKTNFDLDISENGEVTISIIDILGREVATIHNGFLPKGKYKFSWNGTNGYGQILASGSYFALVRLNNKKKIQKLMFLK